MVITHQVTSVLLAIVMMEAYVIKDKHNYNPNWMRFSNYCKYVDIQGDSKTLIEKNN